MNEENKTLDQYYPGLADDCRRTYRRCIDSLRDAAKECGYALTEHGSLNRDIDLVAIPWTENAADPATLVIALIAVAQILDTNHTVFLSEQDKNHGPVKKPHGRLSYSIVMSNGVYIDLCVMPRQANA